MISLSFSFRLVIVDVGGFSEVGFVRISSGRGNRFRQKQSCSGRSNGGVSGFLGRVSHKYNGIL